MRFDIIKKVYFWLAFGVLLMIGSVYYFLTHARLSIEFTGGMKIKIASQLDSAKVKTDINDIIKSSSSSESDVSIVSEGQDTDILIKAKLDNDESFNKMSESVQDVLVSKGYIESKDKILEVSMIGPSVGEYMKSSAQKAIIIGMLFMGVYIFFAFGTMRKFINPLLLGGVTVFTMLFDIIFPAGAYGILMSLNHTVQVDSIFIIAILTVMGYSINDTIIIFDRIRENSINNENKLKQGTITYRKIFEDSLWQTMRRSFGTALSTFLVVLAMYIFGTGSLKLFAYTLGFGILSGSYSSIFLAAPLAYLLSGKMKKEKNIKD